MTKINIVTYLAEENKGTEYEVGFFAKNYLGNIKGRILLPAFQFYRYRGISRSIMGIEIKKIKKKLILVKIGNDKKKPKSPASYRIGYILWIIKCRFLTKNLNGFFWFVTLTQILTIIPIIFFKKKYFMGPLGGQGSFWKYKYLSFTIRIKNFILTKFLYNLNSLFLISNKYMIAHPLLKVSNPKSALVIPAIHQTPQKKNIIPMNKRKNIIFIGRNIEIKMPKVIISVFKILSNFFPQYNFFIIGEGWKKKKVNRNFKILSKINQKKIFKIFERSRLHVFLSFELGGFVLFESTKLGCPNFTLSGFGAQYLVNPSNSFKINPNVRTFDDFINKVVYRISTLIKNDRNLVREASRQYKNSTKYTIEEKFKTINPFIKKIICSYV
jgi:glycosyltransferase involved in cell wall biosynthesis